MAEHLTGSTPRVAVSDFPGAFRAADAGQMQLLPTAPFAISGRLSAVGEEDRYLVTVAPKQKLRFDVVARQFGSPLDGVLTIRKEDGSEQFASGDVWLQQRSAAHYTVPAGVTNLQVPIKDLLGRGGNEFVYRIAVRDQSRPDFSLSLTADKINIPAGATQVVPVQVTRMNYDGPIELALTGQPSKVSLQGNVIPKGATIGLVTLSAQDTSPQSGLTRLIGRATEGSTTPVRAAMFGEVPGPI